MSGNFGGIVAYPKFQFQLLDAKFVREAQTFWTEFNTFPVIQWNEPKIYPVSLWILFSLNGQNLFMIIILLIRVI